MEWADFEELIREKKNKNPVWFQLDSDPPATRDEIMSAEDALGVEFPEEYKIFLLTYGGGYFGFTNVFSVRASSDWYVVLRNSSRENDFLAVSDPGTGDLYGFRPVEGAAGSEVLLWDHETGAICSTPFRNLYDYLASAGLGESM